MTAAETSHCDAGSKAQPRAEPPSCAMPQAPARGAFLLGRPCCSHLHPRAQPRVPPLNTCLLQAERAVCTLWVRTTGLSQLLVFLSCRVLEMFSRTSGNMHEGRKTPRYNKTKQNKRISFYSGSPGRQISITCLPEAVPAIPRQPFAFPGGSEPLCTVCHIAVHHFYVLLVRAAKASSLLYVPSLKSTFFCSIPSSGQAAPRVPQASPIPKGKDVAGEDLLGAGFSPRFTYSDSGRGWEQLGCRSPPPRN